MSPELNDLPDHHAFTPYKAKKGEAYMNADQEAHFREILNAWRRELMEEVGYGARRLTHVAALTLAPSYLGHVTHVILAEDLFEKRLPGDEPEEIEVVPWRLAEMTRLLAHEECTEARSIAALYMVKDLLAGQTTGDGVP